MEKSTKNVKTQEFGNFQIASFSLGSFTQWFINTAFNAWVFSFYFIVVQLPIYYLLWAVLIFSIWNAINDPLIGFLSDRTHTRWGRRKPYIMLGFIPMIIVNVIIWLPPTGDHLMTFFYLLIMLMCFDTFYTMVAIPYESLFPELYISEKERAKANTIKQVLGTIGLVLAFLIPGIFIGELTKGTGYLINGIITSSITGAALIFSLIFGVKEREEFQLDHAQKFGYFEGLKSVLKNKGFVMYTIMYFLFNVLLSLHAVVIPLYAKHMLGINSTLQISLLMGALLIVAIATVIIWKKLDIKIGSRKAYAISIVAYCIAALPILFTTDYIIAIITFGLVGFGYGGITYFIYLLIADVVDEDELKTGVRREGIFFGITNFFKRLSMIPVVVAISLVFISTGWETYTPNPNVDVITGIKILVVLFPGLALGLSLICLYFYPYSKERVEEIKKGLSELHQQKVDKIKTLK
jgi:GPH family glycoside/pentoside/hexuronide:cation symporter